MQQYADIYLLLNYSTCFGSSSRPSSGVHKTVVAASGTDHTIWGANKLLFTKRIDFTCLIEGYVGRLQDINNGTLPFSSYDSVCTKYGVCIRVKVRKVFNTRVRYNSSV